MPVSVCDSSRPAALPAEAATARPPAYPSPAMQPTQVGPCGIRFDFNFGARIALPPGQWRVRLSDGETGNILFEADSKEALVNSTKRHFVRFRVEIWKDREPVLEHDYDAAERDVLVQLPVGTLGDTIGWLPYAVRFQHLHGCRLTIAMAGALIPLFRDAYPGIAFVTHAEVRAERFYATYSIGLFFDDVDHVWQPADFRLVGLHRTAAGILGVDPQEEPPQIGLPDEGPPIDGPYVCIATQSTTQCKYWNNPGGWRDVIAFLKAHGYRVICIDRQPVHGHGLIWNHIPHGAEDQTGDRPLAERVRWLRHAAFFIGLSSGLSWLAWAVGTKVVMISGFTHPHNEFTTPYRVINYHGCNSCWNDPRHRFDHSDFLWCPRHAGTSRQFECTRLITATQVKNAIRRIPGLGRICDA
ncbi:autotransporter strand-loop-strand O-heptosyltransferase [Rhodovastum atsumiense]|nr:autotransporter strand-loop-strand O-heptosyltransferase [Rhodovastum atsumiense]